MPPSMPQQQQDWATARRFFESSLLVTWLEFDDEQQHLSNGGRISICKEDNCSSHPA
ncbi:hypothetical protein HaLaN_32083, partial [Haematococcus lacustris]